MTSPLPIVLVGAGGHAKVVIELIQARGDYTIVGLLDRDTMTRKVLGLDVLGNDAHLPHLRREGIAHAFIALGNNTLRLHVAERATRDGFELVNAISPQAVISPSARIGRGVAIMAGAVVNAETTIGNLAIVNTNAGIDHDCEIGIAAHIGPRCALAGVVQVGRLAFLGTGSSAIPGVRIGESAVIGAGSCIVSDIPAHAKAYGVPARVRPVDENARKSCQS